MGIINLDDLEIAQATATFTDREMPQEAFERKVQVLLNDWNANLSTERNYYILNYYGIGGIGKTRFTREMRMLLNNDPEARDRIYLSKDERLDCDYLYFSFGDEDNSDISKRELLLKWRQMFKSKNKEFVFPRFDAAMFAYAKKKSQKDEVEQEIKGIIAENSLVANLFTITGNVPIVGTMTQVLEALDTGIATIGEMNRQKTRDKLAKEYVRLETDKIIEMLHIYFVQDMNENM